MSNPCNDVYNICNVIIINISWFVEQLCYDINEAKEDLVISFNDFNNINNQIERSAVLEPFHYTHDEKDDYCGDEDWLESWDRV
jgi:hypothetical protein